MGPVALNRSVVGSNTSADLSIRVCVVSASNDQYTPIVKRDGLVKGPTEVVVSACV